MKTILFVESGSGYGGSATCLANLVQELDKNRFRPIVAYYSAGPGIDRIIQAGTPTIRLTRGLRLFQLMSAIKSHAVDLVHANNELYSHVPAVLAASWMRRPCLMHMRGIRKLTRMERWLAKRIRWFIVISKAARRFYTDDGLPDERMETIYDGVDLSRFDRELDGGKVRSDFKLKPEHLVVGMVSRLVPKKGQREFLDALAELAPDFPQMRGVIVGGDPSPEGLYLKELQKKAADLGLSQQVIFPGWRDDVPEVNASFDVAAQPTQYMEGLCAAVAEAMAAARPVVASNMGGIPELIADNETGFLVQPGSAQALARSIRRLLRDAGLRRRLGEAGRDRIRRILDQSRTVRQVESIYTQLLEP